MALRGALIPTPSVVHVAGMTISPQARYPEAEVVTLSIEATGLRRLVNFIDASFDRGDLDRATSTGPGLYPASRFYPGLGNFHLFNTCNTWTARALAYAGFRINGSSAQSAEDLMRQLRPLGSQKQGQL